MERKKEKKLYPVDSNFFLFLIVTLRAVGSPNNSIRLKIYES